MPFLSSPQNFLSLLITITTYETIIKNYQAILHKTAMIIFMDKVNMAKQQ